MTFQSILFDKASLHKESLEQPAYFTDLNLDQVISAITKGRAEYDLAPFFYTPLSEVENIHYRHEIMQGLENEILLENIKSFALKMSEIHRYLVMIDKLNFKYHKEGWLLETVDVYCEAVSCLAHDLSLLDIKARGLLAFREYLTTYVNSDDFTFLMAETKKIKDDLSTVKYCMIAKNLTVRVRKYEEETDYSIEVEKTFEKFKQGAVKDYKVKLTSGSADMNHIEAQILVCVAKLYPDIFSKLDQYCEKHSSFLDRTISIFDREIQFYVAYLEFVAQFKQAGLKFCYPQISSLDKDVYDYEGFDLALANKLIAENSPTVCNDFYLKGRERIFVVSGPNQGGKTTFARMFGQLHHLASLGCPVPGLKAKLFLFDRLFTHFEKEENIKNLRGKLQDDLVRIHDALNQATPNSIIIMNEIFTSTTIRDGIFLSKKVMEIILRLDLLCICVTFMDELASLSEKTVSMVSTIVPENPALRTYKIIRRPADGLAYAISIAEKYRLTYDSLKERIKS